MSDAVSVAVPPGTTQTTITLQLEPRPVNWTDVSVYAPTFPGLIVAILGLWIAHRLAVRRDRRKEILELCDSAKTVLAEAEAACVKAWLSASTVERPSEIHEAKSQLQSLGIIVTDLRRRTKQGVLTHLWHVVFDCLLAIDIVNDVSRLRNLATDDPFEDPGRAADKSRANDVSAAAKEIHGRIDLQFHMLYGFG